MNIPFRALFLFFFVLSLSCEKKSTDPADTVFFGTVVDAKTKQPIAEVSILEIYSCPYSYYTTKDTTRVTKTDKDGKFQFKQKIVQSTSNPSESRKTYFLANCNGYSDGQLS